MYHSVFGDGASFFLSFFRSCSWQLQTMGLNEKSSHRSFTASDTRLFDSLSFCFRTSSTLSVHLFRCVSTSSLFASWLHLQSLTLISMRSLFTNHFFNMTKTCKIVFLAFLSVIVYPVASTRQQLWRTFPPFSSI